MGDLVGFGKEGRETKHSTGREGGDGEYRGGLGEGGGGGEYRGGLGEGGKKTREAKVRIN